ncbi:hypothetical protein GUITHDRAFT_160844 [Guillardia theta CCMP2712]|uniref:Calmodulin-lysine N-methyltransferase n=1 Tax=Guillardia theta (strain CCMP2712) TaxID=905079 RepID=L1K1G4_GUITC|nr:hypothetical protein GUITHDRAFT_160844 [Guillardia theta CCMP2712]EKX54218.1 hypothetical protein GUITHDRAFT_160844 [Guillardia theta CCMP2712]|mmetsp:Transcript_20219/g.67543  ORF Transcript_20219/g.67543 Transcript_20219/m.67543 type:complete len:308 (+) Transcript_20219:95-1018(+)|eukprot:XP_005841198.1 hypothetical protein GUITHDRAFT_160844 [Guillardia theta CCMP2712]
MSSAWEDADMEGALKIPPRNLGVRSFPGGIKIMTNTKLLLEDTGGDVWKGAIALGRFMLAEFSEVLAESRVLELAAGTGYLGLTLSVKGAARVVMSDKECMISLLHGNILLNSDSLELDARPIEAITLDWNHGEEAIALMKDESFDFIIMSDVFYEEEIVEPLIRTLRTLCCLHARRRKPLKNMSEEELPQIYISASHRSERIEGLFMQGIKPWFSCEEIRSKNHKLNEVFRKEMIVIFKLAPARMTFDEFAAGLGLSSMRSNQGRERKNVSDCRKDNRDPLDTLQEKRIVTGSCHFAVGYDLELLD